MFQVHATAALLLGAWLGHLQESAYLSFGKVWKENMFYTHLFAIPCFMITASDILHHSQLLFHLSPLVIDLLGVTQLNLPMWSILALNLVLQSVCVRGVFMLTSATGTLTTTLLLTTRKFISLIVSIAYFRHPSTVMHWIGTVLVFGGVALFNVPDQHRTEEEHQKKHA